MLFRHFSVGLVLAVTLLTTFASGQFERETIVRGKRATALVVLPSERGFGTAFCMDESGYFFTNEHVIRHSADAPIRLVLNAGEEKQRTIEARLGR